MLSTTTKQDILIATRVNKPTLDRIESWRAQTRPVMARSEALRQLIETGLESEETTTTT
jgi:hypothetical protein